VLRSVDFGANGASSVELRVATPLLGVSIELRASEIASATSADGARLVAKCDVPATGGWQVWKSLRCALPHGSAVGVHAALFWVFRCSGCRERAVPLEGLLNVHYWQFFGGPASDSPPAPTTVHVHIRARGAGRFLCVDSASGAVQAACAAAGAPGTRFTLVDNDDGSWAMGAGARRLCVRPADGVLRASEPESGSVAECAQFRLQPTVDGSWAVQSYSARRWLVAAVAGGEVVAAADDPRGLDGDAARFEMHEVV
jgi:hypothetical protein